MKNNIILFLLLIVSFIEIYNLKANFKSVSASNSIWTSLSNLPFTLHNNPTYIFNNNIFSFGGSANYVHNEVVSSIIDPGGYLSSWSSSSSSAMPKRLFWHNAAFSNQNVYILGGCEYPNNITISTNSAYLSHINLDVIHEWLNVTELPNPIADGAAVSVGEEFIIPEEVIGMGQITIIRQ